jgi:hypothetical protein
MIGAEKRQDVTHYKELIRKVIAEKKKHHYQSMNAVEWAKIDGFYQRLIRNYRSKIELAREDTM